MFLLLFKSPIWTLGPHEQALGAVTIHEHEIQGEREIFGGLKVSVLMGERHGENQANEDGEGVLI